MSFHPRSHLPSHEWASTAPMGFQTSPQETPTAQALPVRRDVPAISNYVTLGWIRVFILYRSALPFLTDNYSIIKGLTVFILPLKDQHRGLVWGAQSKQSLLIMPWPSFPTPQLCRERARAQNQHYGWVSACMARSAQSTSFIGFETAPEYADHSPRLFCPVPAHTSWHVMIYKRLSTYRPLIGCTRR